MHSTKSVVGLIYSSARGVGLFLMLMIITNSAYGQHIVLTNPSLEGGPKVNAAPYGWAIAANTPDLLPGFAKVDLTPSDGISYAGFHSNSEWLEGIEQHLNGTLIGGKVYSLSMDLAYASEYFSPTCYGAMVIYGGNAPGDTAEILWKSGEFYNTQWKRYQAMINPSRDYTYISFWTYISLPCDKGKMGVAFLLDNLSTIKCETPQLIIAVQNTCKPGNMGNALVKVIDGEGPFTYFWKPGGQTMNQISNLAAGTYEVTVTAANGVTTVAEVNIKEEQFQNEVFTLLSKCNNNKENELLITTSGGTPPYRYYLNEGHTASYVPVFKNLASGNYNLLVKDDRGCTDLISNINFIEPPPLQITSIYTQPVSCSETQDGKIALDVRGGTAPYSYSLDFHSWQRDSSWNQLDAGRYYFQIKDNNGCSITGTTEVTKNWRDCLVLVPTAFSPNGDGLNDIFRAKVHDEVRDFKLIVYNRWGQLVFQSNDPAQGWDGGQQTTGTFLWVLMYTDSKNQNRKQQGNLVLIK